jgi:hypothetical protein
MKKIPTPKIKAIIPPSKSLKSLKHSKNATRPTMKKNRIKVSP